MRRYVTLLSILALFGCATEQVPNGGPKDKLPPVLTSSIPNNKQTDFTGKNIELTFNEYIQLNNAREEIIISPAIKEGFEITSKANKVVIKPKGPWQRDITYSVMFRDAIMDITEKNIPPNLKLAFSTGKVLDSLHISGRILDALSSIPQDKITVAVFRSDTFNIFTHIPSYFSKTDKKGNFVIENLQAGDYYIYAFKDANKNLKVDSKSEAHGFLAQAINLTAHKDSLRIPLYRLDTRPIKIQSVRHNGRYATVRFTKSTDALKLRSKARHKYQYADAAQTELTIYTYMAPEDSAEFHITATDSALQKLDTTFYIKPKSGKPSISEALKWTANKPKLTIPRAQLAIDLQFNKLINSITYDSIVLQLDSSTFISPNASHIKYDTIHRQLHIRQDIPTYTPNKKFPPKLTFLSSAFITEEDDSTKKQNAELTLLTPENTGTLLLKIETKQKDYIIQLLDKDGKQLYESISQPNIVFTSLPPADYRIRIVIDSNKNKRWDPGNFTTKTEPEKTILFLTPQKKTLIPIRANWEVGPYTISF